MQEETRGGNVRDLGQVCVFVIRALDRCNGQPMPGPTLEDTVSLAFPHLTDAKACAAQVMLELRARGLIASIEREVDGMDLWVLTDKGRGALAAMPTR